MINILKIKSEIYKFAQKYGIKFIILFGSQVKETLKKESDFDVAISLNNGRSIFDDSKLYSELLENFSHVFNAKEDKIDLTDLDKVNILLRYDVTSGGKLLYGDENNYAQYRAFAFREYIDAKPLFRLEDYLINKRQRLINEALLK
ncbi:MAG: nucleotidyltransferase domain-containing protein [Patescibacteria group bacterium]